VRAAQSRDWDVILLDHGLPGGAGPLYDRLLATAPRAAARVAFTGPAEASAARSPAAAARPWLDKPFDLASLAGRLRADLS
ncbi:MAG: hypothetical protein ACK5Z1_05415, partial [Gemmatimonadota bacterium]